MADKSRRSRNCPECGWRYPIAQISAPGRRREGAAFDCPGCGTRLIYRSGGSGFVFRFFTVITVPVAVALIFFEEAVLFRQIVLFCLLPLAVLAAIYCYRAEYVESA